MACHMGEARSSPLCALTTSVPRQGDIGLCANYVDLCPKLDRTKPNRYMRLPDHAEATWELRNRADRSHFDSCVTEAERLRRPVRWR